MYYDETDTTPRYLYTGTSQITYKKIYYSSGTSSCSPTYDDSLDTCTPYYYETTNYDAINIFDEEIMKSRYRPLRTVIKSITPRKKFLIPTRTIRIGREKYPSGKNFCKSPSRSCRQLKIRI